MKLELGIRAKADLTDVTLSPDADPLHRLEVASGDYDGLCFVIDGSTAYIDTEDVEILMAAAATWLVHARKVEAQRRNARLFGRSVRR